MQYVVFTDLDGSLLDHENYQYSDAMPAIRILAHKGIPVIPVTSKTRSEIDALRKELKLNTPFIIENGAAVYVPDTHMSFESELPKHGRFFVKAFSPDIVYWSSVIEELSQSLPNTFRAFSQMTVGDIVELTGLSLEEAALASQREFSDPLHWFGSQADLAELVSLCAALNVDVVKGGRFVHLIKGANKGKAVSWLLDHYRKDYLEVKSIALGDGENDLSMLEEVDFPVQIKSPAHEFPFFTHPNLIRTKDVGPRGWCEAISAIV